MMKKFAFVLIACLAGIYAASAQSYDDYGYVFSDFQQGIIRQKSGPAIAAMMNYDMIEQQMQYLEDEKLYALSTENIVAVYIQERKFVPSAKRKSYVFYEEKPLVNGDLYVQHRMVFVQRGKEAGYNTTSQTIAATNISSITFDGRMYNLNAAIKHGTQDASMFYIAVNGKYKKIYNLTSLTSAFKPHKAQLRQFAAEKNTDFASEADVAAIVNYAFGL